MMRIRPSPPSHGARALASLALVVVAVLVVTLVVRHQRSGGQPGPGPSAGPPRPLTGVQPADSFVDSIGVNVHLHYTDTSYAAFDAVVRPRLDELGVRHIRDGAYTYPGSTRDDPYYQQLRTLAADGISADLITSLAVGSTQATDYGLLPQLADWTDGSLENLEGVNEPDHSGLVDWAAQTRTALGDLAATVAASPELSGVQVIGPSLTSVGAAGELGDVADHEQIGNLHDYYAGNEPETTGFGDGGYGSLDYDLAAVATISPGSPVVSTESGYPTSSAPASDDSASVPPEVAATYVPRLLLGHFDAGIARTYLYELLDERDDATDPEANFGLLRPDGTPKPAFTAVQSMITLLSDPGPSFTPTPLDHRLTGQTGGVRQTILQKRDGSTYLALWLADSVWNPQTHTELDVTPHHVGLDLPEGYRVDGVSTLGTDGVLAADPTPNPAAGATPTFDVGPQVSFVRIVPAE